MPRNACTVPTSLPSTTPDAVFTCSADCACAEYAGVKRTALNIASRTNILETIRIIKYSFRRGKSSPSPNVNLGIARDCKWKAHLTWQLSLLPPDPYSLTPASAPPPPALQSIHAVRARPATIQLHSPASQSRAALALGGRRRSRHFARTPRASRRSRHPRRNRTALCLHRFPQLPHGVQSGQRASPRPRRLRIHHLSPHAATQSGEYSPRRSLRRGRRLPAPQAGFPRHLRRPRTRTRPRRPRFRHLAALDF